MTNIVGPWPDPEVTSIDNNGLMVHPWIKYPSLPKGSLGWRMGIGQQYWQEFCVWWSRQVRETQLRVPKTYPEAAEWIGFYSSL